MPIAKITGPGLAAIGLAVFALWGCVIGERSVERQAVTERVRVMRELVRLQQRQRSEPVSLPSRQNPRHGRVSAG